MNNVSYKILKRNILRSLRQTKQYSMEFAVDYDTLRDNVEDINLVPIPFGLKAKRVKMELVPYLNEYFEKERLAWFNSEKFSTVLAFIDAEYVTEEVQELLDKINTPDVDIPDEDKVKDVAYLLSTLPCYYATVVSYQSNNPNLQGKASYETVCRANKVVIRNSDYQYNPDDMS